MPPRTALVIVDVQVNQFEGPFAVHEGDDVEAVFDREAVAQFLVASVALIFRIAQDRDAEVASLILMLQPGREGRVLG